MKDFQRNHPKSFDPRLKSWQSLLRNRMNTLKPKEMIQWFRTKAAEFERIADTLEATFSPAGEPAIHSQANGRGTTKEVGVSEIQNFLKKTTSGAARYNTIADGLGADPEVVSKFLRAHLGKEFELKGRG